MDNSTNWDNYTEVTPPAFYLTFSYYSWADDSIVTQIRVWASRIMPVIAAVLSIPLCIISALIFTIDGCGLPFNVRFYYTLMAVMNVGYLAFFQVLQYVSFMFQSDSLTLSRNNVLLCKLTRAVSIACFQTSSLTMAFFAVERFFVVYFPMRVKFTKFSRYMLGLTILGLVASFLSNVYLVFYYNIYRIRTAPFTVCTMTSKSVGRAVLAYAVLWQDFLPTVIEMLCNCALCVKLSTNKAERSLVVGRTVGSELSRSDLSTTVTLIAIGLVHAAMMLAETACWLIHGTLAQFYDMPIPTRSLWFSAAFLTVLCDTTVLSIADFALYCTRITRFRKVLFCACKLLP